MDSAKEAEDKMPEGVTVNYVQPPARKRELLKQVMDPLEPEQKSPKQPHHQPSPDWPGPGTPGGAGRSWEDDPPPPQGACPISRLAPGSNLHPELLLRGVNGTAVRTLSSSPSLDHELSTNDITWQGIWYSSSWAPEEPFTAQPSAAFKISNQTPSLALPAVSSLWSGKTLDLIRHTVYSPIPVAFLVSAHTDKFHRAGSGTQLLKVFRFLAQFWLQSVNIDPEIPPCED